MARIMIVRHGKAEMSGTGPDVQRALTPQGCEEVFRMQDVLKKLHFSPDLVVESGTARTAGTAFLLAGDAVRTIKLPELRLMGTAEYRVIRDIMLSQGEGATFRTLLASDMQGIWMKHARLVAQLLRDIIAKNDAHQVLVVTHGHTMNALGRALVSWEVQLLLDSPFGYAEGFMIDETNNTVTRIAKDSP